MNGSERVLSALQGRWPDKTPVLLLNFMMAAKEAGLSMGQYRESPKEIARAFIEAVEKYRYDGIYLEIDTSVMAGALGVPVDLPDHEPGRCTGGLLASLDNVDKLKTPDVGQYRYVQHWLEAASLLRAHFKDEICLRGNCDQGPFSLASLVRTPGEWMMDLLDEEKKAAAHALLEYCTGAVRQFMSLMKEAGAHILSNGDSFSSPDLVSPAVYREFALPYQKKAGVHAHSLGLPYVLHVCGKTDLILPDLVKTGADGLELDYKTDLRLAHDTLKGHAAFFGNIDPTGVLAHGTPALVRQKTQALLELFADTPRFVLNAGCAIPASTPPENIFAMVETARAFR